MIQNFHVITKGAYEHEQTNERLHIERFLIVRKRKRRFLLLDVNNRSKETMSALKLQIEQFDGRGNALGTSVMEFKRLEVKSGKSILKKQIELYSTCLDFKVKILYAKYGNYFYCYGEEGNYVTYEKSAITKRLSDAEIARRAGKDGITKEKRKFKAPVFISVMVAVLMVVSAAGVFAHLRIFTKDRKSFFLQNIEYEMVGKEINDETPVYVTGYKGAGGEEIVIPAKVDDHPVVGIAKGAFANNTIIKKVTLEEGVDVSARAFANCSRLEKVELLGNNIIYEEGFANCSRLSNISMVDVERIEKNAFKNIASISSLTIKQKSGQLVDINATAFSGCSKFGNVRLDGFINQDTILFPDVETISSLYLKNFYYSSYKTTDSHTNIASLFNSGVDITSIEIDYMDEIPANFASGIDSSLESIKVNHLTKADVGEKAFYNCTRLNNVSFASAISNIGNYAFANTDLESFASKSLLTMGVSAFEGCASLKSVDLSESVSLKAIPQSSFMNCESLETVKLASSIRSIESGAFLACKSLKDVQLPSELYSIGESAFYQCSNLRYLQIPEKVESIASTAFKACYRLYEIENLSRVKLTAMDTENERYTIKIYHSSEEERIPKETFNGCTIANVGDTWYLVDYDKEATSLSLPQSQNIELLPYTFYAETELEMVTIPSNVFTIGKNVFLHSGIKTLTFSGGDNALTWDTHAFYGANYIEKIDFGQRYFEQINNNIFNGYASLKEVKLSPAVKKIGESAFASCSNLSKVSAPGVEEIGVSAFTYCTSLKDVSLGQNLTWIKSEAFNDCTSLTNLTFPNSLKKIDSYAFDGCNALKQISINNVTTIGNNAFSGCSALTSASLSFSSDYNGTLTSIGSYAFGNCSELKNVSLSGLTSIGNDAFSGCSNLTNVSLGGVSSIGNDAFSGCSKLTQISLPSTLTLIGSSAFYDCDSLQQLTIPSSLTVVSDYMAYSCDALTKVVIENGVKTIGYYAFAECKALSSVSLGANVGGDNGFIGNYAFGGCDSLHEVYNYSSLYISKDSTDNGYVGYNAIAIHDSRNDWLQSYTAGDFIFKYSNDGVWALVDYTGSDASVRLNAITVNGSLKKYEVARYAFRENTITKVIIGNGVTSMRSYAFQLSNLTWLTFENVNSQLIIPSSAFAGCGSLTNVMIPQGLKGIQSNAFNNNYIAVYYDGDSYAWNNNSSKYQLGYNYSLYYKDAYDCAHEYNQWRYVNGEISTSDRGYNQERITKQATCTTDGTRLKTCSTCGKQKQETIYANGHNYTYSSGYYGDNGKCSVCGYYKNFVLNKNSLTAAQDILGITNNTQAPFNVFSADTATINIASLKAVDTQLIITSKSKITISFDVACTGAQSIVTVKVGGKTTTLQGGKSQEFTSKLSANDTIVITYKHVVPANTNAVQGTAKITNVKITSQVDPS